MKQGIRIVGSILLATALASPAWAGNGHGKGNNGGGGNSGGGESQAGGLPGLEDRVEADEALIATLQSQVSTLQGQVATLIGEVATLTTEVATLTTEVNDLEGQNNFVQVSSACAVVNSHSTAGTPTAASEATGECEVTFAKNVSGCSAVATIVGALGEIAVTSETKTITGDSVEVFTDVPAGTPANEAFNLTVTCP